VTKHRNTLFIGILFIFILSACASQPPASPLVDEIASTTTQVPEPTFTLTPAPTPTQTPLPASDGPVLLLQTDIDTFEIIDFALNLQHPFEPPAGSSRLSLGGSLSPGRTRLIIPGGSGQTKIMDLITGYVRPIESDISGFDPDQAAEAALAALPGMKLSYDGALSAVKSAFESSNVKMGWFQDDDHLALVTVGSPTSTNLTIRNTLTGEDDVLETLPGLVENFRRNGDWILLKKSYDFEPGIWQDDRYALVNLTTREVKSISLPDDVDNPSLSWFGRNTIAIIHQIEPVGGFGYSILDVEIMETQQVIDGAFSSVLGYREGLLDFRQDYEAFTTTVQRLDLAGEVQKEITLAERCSPYRLFGEKVLVNCETQSLILNPNLDTSPFGDPIFLLTHSPDGSVWALITRTEEVFLLDAALENPAPLDLEGTPLEVRWLPDSTGFLYRIFGKLFLYNLENDSSRLLIESDLFSDYANLNAAWISLK
jgi:hypothetical protein